MTDTAVVEPDAKDADEFAAGWNDSEFGDPAAPPEDSAAVAAAAAKEAADAKAAADAAVGSDAEATTTDAAGTDDTDANATAKADADAAAAAAKESSADAKDATAGDYKPDYAEAVAGIRRDTEQGFSRIEKLIEKRSEPAVEPAKTAVAPKRVDLAEFTGDKLKTRLEKVRDVAPEAAEAFEPIIEGLAGALGDSYKELDTVRATATDTRAATVQQAQFSPIEAKHPGFQKTIEGEEFLKWLDEQPGKVMRTAHNTNDPDEFVGILDQFAARDGAAAGDGASADAATDTKKDESAAAAVDDDAARVEARREAARQPETRTTADRQPDKARELSDTEEFSKGWFDPEFDQKN